MELFEREHYELFEGEHHELFKGEHYELFEGEHYELFEGEHYELFGNQCCSSAKATNRELVKSIDLTYHGLKTNM